MKIGMKISVAALLVAVLAITMLIVTPINAGQGNGLPSGKHYTLNLLGKTWEKGNAADSDDPYLNPVVKDNDNGECSVSWGKGAFCQECGKIKDYDSKHSGFVANIW